MADTPDTPETKAPPKPRARRSTPKPATPRAKPAAKADADTPTVAKAKPAKAPPKPRSSNRAKPTRTTKAKAATASVTDKVGGKWGVAAIGTGVVAAAGVAAALLLRGDTPKDGKPANAAEQADGTDSSKSFEAGIADEGSVPK